MIGEIIILCIAGLILLLPLVFWMYIYTAFFEYGISRVEFCVGLVTGAIATLPLLGHEYFFLGVVLDFIFLPLSGSSQQSIFPGVIGGLFIFTLMVSCIVCCARMVFVKDLRRSGVRFLQVFFGVLLVLLVTFVGIYIVQTLFPRSQDLPLLQFGDIVFSTLGAIFAYYIVIAFLEETSKYAGLVSVASKKPHFQILQSYLAVAACVALGFAFFENALYMFQFTQRYGVDAGLISLIFFRSIFAVVLHIFASVLFALGFWYIKQVFVGNMKALGLFLFFSCGGLVTHMLYDSFLTFGMLGAIFFFIVGLYIFLTLVHLPKN